ncbi:MAG: hypothetical protein ACTHOM_04865 [Allomuricauda sp.]
MENSIHDEAYRLTIENDKKQLAKAKDRFEKSYNQLLEKEKQKGKELDLRIEKLEKTIMAKYNLQTREEYWEWIRNDLFQKTNQ